MNIVFIINDIPPSYFKTYDIKTLPDNLKSLYLTKSSPLQNKFISDRDRGLKWRHQNFSF